MLPKVFKVLNGHAPSFNREAMSDHLISSMFPLIHENSNSLFLSTRLTLSYRLSYIENSEARLGKRKIIDPGEFSCARVIHYFRSS